jgi:hypothetical protein
MKWLVGVLVATSVHAQPSDEFEACKARRKELTAEAMKHDAAERGERLAAMPICRRNDDGSTSVTERAPDPIDASAYSPLVIGARVGVAGSAINATNDHQPVGMGAYVDVEAGFRWSRAYSVQGYVNYSRFADDVFAVGVPGHLLHVSDRVYGGGIRATRHTFMFSFGGGLGAQVDSSTRYMGVVTDHAMLAAEEFVGYRLASARYGNAGLRVMLTEAFGLDRQMLSVQVGVGYEL